MWCRIGETSHVDFDGAKIDNLIVVIMEALQNGGGLSSTIVAEKFFFGGAHGVNTFQGIKTGVIKQINTNYAPLVHWG